MSGQNALGGFGGKEQKSGSSGGSSGPSISLETPHEAVVDFILYGVEAGNGFYEWHVFDEDATEVSAILEGEVPDDLRDILERFPEDVTHLSFESFFQVDLAGEGIEYVGTVPLLNEGDKDEWSELDDDVKEQYSDELIYKYGEEENGLKSYIPKPDWIDVVENDKVDDSVIYEASTILNGLFYPAIWNELYTGEPVKLGVGIGRNQKHEDEDGEVDEFEKRRAVAFAKQTGKSSGSSVVTAMENMGTIDEQTATAFEDGEMTLAQVVNGISSDDDEE